jgi:hypothetical protein
MPYVGNVYLVGDDRIEDEITQRGATMTRVFGSSVALPSSGLSASCRDRSMSRATRREAISELS